MLTTRKRVALPFLFRAADCRGASGKLIARSYGSELEGVFTRASVAGHITIGASNYVLGRTPHSVPRVALPWLTGSGAATALVVEPGTTNLAPYSADFTSWDNTNVTVTPNAVADPAGTTLADLLDATSAVTDARSDEVTFTGNGVKSISVFFRGNTSALMGLGLWDATAATWRSLAEVSTAGTANIVAGTGTVLAAPWEDWSGVVWWHVKLSVPSVVAANANHIYVFPDRTSGTGSIYAWGAQAENAPWSSSPVATSGGTATRAADNLYFPFTLPPQACTFYFRGFEQYPTAVAPSTDRYYLSVGLQANATVAVFQGSGGPHYFYHQASAGVSSSATPGAVVGDRLEVRGVLGSTGTTLVGTSVNAGTETLGSTSASEAFLATWNQARIYLGAVNGAAAAPFAFTHVAVALGTKTMAEMRDLAEVV